MLVENRTPVDLRFVRILLYHESETKPTSEKLSSMYYMACFETLQRVEHNKSIMNAESGLIWSLFAQLYHVHQTLSSRSSCRLGPSSKDSVLHGSTF